MLVSDLITDPLLRLELATPSGRNELDARISSAVATESIDPAAYLSPGTLVLTTGMALNFDDPRIWDGYVERLLNAEVAALAFGLGKPHTSVPARLMESARQHGLPVLAVPSEVPFLHLQNLVHRALAEEDFQASRLGWSIAEECTGMAARGRELNAVLNHVATRARIELRIIDEAGVVFAVGGQPIAAESGEDPPPPKGARAAVLSLPLVLDDDAKWSLQCFAPDGTSSDTQLRTILAPAAAVLSMILSRILGSPMWESESSAELLGALERTDGGASASVVSALRKSGIDLSRGVRLISIRSRSAIRLHLLSWRLLQSFDESDSVIPMETESAVLLLVTPSTQERRPRDQAEASFSRLVDEANALTDGSGDSIYFSELHRSAPGLCLFTALHLSRRPSTETSTGVHVVGAPQLEDIINLIPPTLSTAMSESFLAPVLSSSRASELLRSLAAFIDTTTLAQAAVRLGVHRNTTRAHRAELEELLGIDLSNGADRSMCALALAVREQ